jgi:hypothetical protein
MGMSTPIKKQLRTLVSTNLNFIPRSANNINALIKDLLLIPPAFKTKIVLSWKPETQVTFLRELKVCFFGN